MDIGCFSHTLDLVGTKFNFPTVDEFMKHWEAIFMHSCKSKLLWREQTGMAIRPTHLLDGGVVGSAQSK